MTEVTALLLLGRFGFEPPVRLTSGSNAVLESLDDSQRDDHLCIFRVCHTLCHGHELPYLDYIGL